VVSQLSGDTDASGVEAKVRISAVAIRFANVEHPLFFAVFVDLAKIKVGLPIDFSELICHAMGILWGKANFTSFLRSCKSLTINGAPSKS
jgi:hypothetical protein